MPVITLEDLQKLTKHSLVADDQLIHWDRGLADYVTYRESERAREKRDSTHRLLREAAEKHFLNQGWGVVPHGVAVDGTFAMCDLAIAKGKKIVLVECKSCWDVRLSGYKHKLLMAQHFQLWFVIEDPAIIGNTAYRRRAERLANRSRVLVWSERTGGLTRYSVKRNKIVSTRTKRGA